MASLNSLNASILSVIQTHEHLYRVSVYFIRLFSIAEKKPDDQIEPVCLRYNLNNYFTIFDCIS